MPQPGYHAPAAEKEAAGGESPITAAMSRPAQALRLFCALVRPVFGRPGGEPQGSPVPCRSLNPFGRPPHLRVRRAVANRTRRITMATIAHQGASAPHDDLIVRLNPYDLGFSEFIGTRALLEAEGVIPAGTDWPQAYDDLRWQAGKFDYWLCRERPPGAKGARRAFITVDWFCLRITPSNQPSQAARDIARKALELKNTIYRNSPQGEAERSAQWGRYWASAKDKAFQKFKADCGIVERKRGRPRKNVETDKETNHVR